ncbi:hypothetical protein [Aurantibacter sp.]|uniref:hypothetical protein n=1 Tax=Aurantibacter sp. TaxID=2807103 RepID=UPI0035C819A4
MTKLKLEFIRLGLAFFTFAFTLLSLFMYINQVNGQWFRIIGELLTIPVILLTAGIPIWLIIDLIKKNVADKSIFNLTFFISVISVALLFFALNFLS